ncbi:unnamed protein product, partial [Allacma fusca]
MALRATFAGKRVLVTGGAMGIGRAIVDRLAKDNAIVTALDVNETELKELKQSLPKITEEDFNQIFNVNVKAVINITQMVVQAMIANKIQGSVVNVSSV